MKVNMFINKKVKDFKIRYNELCSEVSKEIETKYIGRILYETKSFLISKGPGEEPISINKNDNYEFTTKVIRRGIINSIRIQGTKPNIIVYYTNSRGKDCSVNVGMNLQERPYTENELRHEYIGEYNTIEVRYVASLKEIR